MMNQAEELKENFYKCVHLELTLAITSMLYEKLDEAPQKETPDMPTFNLLSQIVMVIEQRLEELLEALKNLPD